MVSGQRRSYARLHDCVALYNAPFAIAESWPIERVRHRADQSNGSALRQARVRIERDYIANACKVSREVATDRQKCGARRTAQEVVQFMKLSSLAFPAHP